jgi:two-component system nitrate/nitrite response regulator NarL
MPGVASAARVAIGLSARTSADWISLREREVLDMLVEGLTVPEIAGRLNRSPHTVHDHVKSLHRKLGAKSRGELVAAALGHPREGGDRG